MICLCHLCSVTIVSLFLFWQLTSASRAFSRMGSWLPRCAARRCTWCASTRTLHGRCWRSTVVHSSPLSTLSLPAARGRQQPTPTHSHYLLVAMRPRTCCISLSLSLSPRNSTLMSAAASVARLVSAVRCARSLLQCAWRACSARRRPRWSCSCRTTRRRTSGRWARSCTRRSRATRPFRPTRRTHCARSTRRRSTSSPSAPPNPHPHPHPHPRIALCHRSHSTLH